MAAREADTENEIARYKHAAGELREIMTRLCAAPPLPPNTPHAELGPAIRKSIRDERAIVVDALEQASDRIERRTNAQSNVSTSICRDQQTIEDAFTCISASEETATQGMFELRLLELSAQIDKGAKYTTQSIQCLEQLTPKEKQIDAERYAAVAMREWNNFVAFAATMEKTVDKASFEIAHLE